MLTTILLASLSQTADLRFTPADVDSLPLAATQVDEAKKELIIELTPVDVPPNGMLRTAVHRARVPFKVSLHGFRVEVVDEEGRILDSDRLHHFNFTDPDRRELFAPLPLHIMAASKETPAPSVPWFLLGMPLEPGERYIAHAMLANPESRPMRLRARLVFDFIRPGLIFPLFEGYPWVMDVKFPLGGEGGRKDFDLPQGESMHYWESRPAVPGTIIGLGGHVHDFATTLELRDMTDDKVIWRQEPVREADGTVHELPVGRLYRWYRLGIHIEPSHVYRVTVFYDNPTGATIPFGGMGAVAGLFRPDRGADWPRVDPADPIYLTYIDNLLKNMQGLEMGHGADGHSHAAHKPL